MDSSFEIDDIRQEREKLFKEKTADFFTLNALHDQIMDKTLKAVIASYEKTEGAAPAAYCFFVMGSAGRREQGIWSDQDHGIVHKGSGELHSAYFQNLGKSISEGLAKTNYKKCEGNVMASNPLWCKSLEDWLLQIDSWTDEASWETIRHLLTFIDGRGIYGETSQMEALKRKAYQGLHQKQLLPRIVQNTKHVRKSIGIFGQLLLETHGPFTGMLNIKDTGLFPYVNAARLLAIHGEIFETETVERIRGISEGILTRQKRERYINNFLTLQEFRLAYSPHKDYESGHYIQPDLLNRGAKKQLKDALKSGLDLFETAARLIEEDESAWA